jgi:hypothetical protein
LRAQIPNKLKSPNILKSKYFKKQTLMSENKKMKVNLTLINNIVAQHFKDDFGEKAKYK